MHPTSKLAGFIPTRYEALGSISQTVGRKNLLMLHDYSSGKNGTEPLRFGTAILVTEAS